MILREKSYYTVSIDTGCDIVCTEEEHLNQHAVVFHYEESAGIIYPSPCFDDLLYTVFNDDNQLLQHPQSEQVKI